MNHSLEDWGLDRILPHLTGLTSVLWLYLTLVQFVSYFFHYTLKDLRMPQK